MTHDRIHARRPAHDIERFEPGIVRTLRERDGHCVVTVAPEGEDPEPVELVVTFAVRDLFLDRLDLDGGSPVGERVWFRKHGGR